MTPQQETLTLDSVIGSRCNNVNLIKLISAFAVIISHSSPLFGESSVLLSALLSHLPLGTIAVSTFFFFAGLYIAKSCESHPTPSSFFRTRCKRLIPELALVTAACVFIVGPIFSIYKLSDYFSRPATYAYLLNAFLIPVHNLPGVFLNNPYGSTVNGSLWTMPVEFFLLCMLLYRIHRDAFQAQRHPAVFCRNKHLQSSLMVKCAVALLLLSTCIYVLHRCVVLRISFKSSHHQAIRNSIDNFLFPNRLEWV